MEKDSSIWVAETPKLRKGRLLAQKSVNVWKMKTSSKSSPVRQLRNPLSVLYVGFGVTEGWKLFWNSEQPCVTCYSTCVFTDNLCNERRSRRERFHQDNSTMWGRYQGRWTSAMARNVPEQKYKQENAIVQTIVCTNKNRSSAKRRRLVTWVSNHNDLC